MISAALREAYYVSRPLRSRTQRRGGLIPERGINLRAFETVSQFLGEAHTTMVFLSVISAALREAFFLFLARFARVRRDAEG